MKLNRKGYMLVEIILASVLAMTIAYYLLNLTYRYKDENQDLYQSIYYNTDKILITKNIMSDLQRGEIVDYELSNNKDELIFNLVIDDSNNDEINPDISTRKLVVDKKNKKIYYGEVNNDESHSFITSDKSYYEKELNKSLMVGDIYVDNDDGNDGIGIEIPLTDMYTDKVYLIKLFSRKYNQINLNLMVNVD